MVTIDLGRSGRSLELGPNGMVNIRTFRQTKISNAVGKNLGSQFTHEVKKRWSRRVRGIRRKGSMGCTGRIYRRNLAATAVQAHSILHGPPKMDS